MALLHLPIVLLPLAVLGAWVAAGSWPEGHDGLRHFRLAEEFRDAWHAGRVYPRWMPELLGGHGYPTFVFYQPGFFFAFTAASLLLRDTLLAAAATVFAALVAGGAGAALLGRRLSGSAAAGALTGLAFLLTPYVWVDLLVRGDLSELTAMMLTPWPFAFLVGMVARAKAARPLAGEAAAAGVGLAAVTYAHPFVALFAYPAAGLAAMALLAGAPRRVAGRALAGTAGALGLGAALSAPYWLPASLARSHVAWQGALDGYYAAEGHLVEFAQLVSRSWGHGSSMPGPGDGMSFQLGLPHLLLAILGTLVARRDPARRALFGVYLVLVLLMTPVATPLWQTGIRVVQFPWRLLAVIATVQAACIAGAAPLLAGRPMLVHAGIAAGLVALGLAWSPRQFSGIAPHDDVRGTLAAQRAVDARRMETWAAVNEFLPATADARRLRPRGARGDLEVVEGEAAVAAEGASRHRFRFRVTAAAPCTVALAQLWFPGWDVRVDGRRVPDDELRAALAPDGLLRVRLPPGAHTVEARYGGPPGRRVAAALALLAAAVAGAAALRALRTRDGSA